MKLPMNALVAKELELRGTFRFHEEFALAVTLIGKGLVDVKAVDFCDAALHAGD